jgi:outer membrane protein insertion porin family
VALIPRQTVASDGETQGTRHATRHLVKLLAVVAVVAGCASTPRATCGEGWASLSRDRGVPRLGLETREFRYIDNVHITGVNAHLASALRAELQTKVGLELSVAPLADDLRRLWKLGVIEDASVTVDQGDVTFVLTPRRMVTGVVGKGGDKLAQSRFRQLDAAPFEPSRIYRMTEALQQSYVREGRLDAQVEARQRVHPTGVEVCVATNPGPRITIAKVEFPGAKAVPANALMKVLRGKEGNFNRPGGVFDESALSFDEIFLQVEYWERGYADVQIGKPTARRRGKRVNVAIPITEGRRYRLGTITAPIPVALRSGDVFRRSDIVKALEDVRKLPVTNVYPQTTLDKDAGRIDITFELEWRYPWDALRFWLALSRSPRA